MSKARRRWYISSEGLVALEGDRHNLSFIDLEGDRHDELCISNVGAGLRAFVGVRQGELYISTIGLPDRGVFDGVFLNDDGAVQGNGRDGKPCGLQLLVSSNIGLKCRTCDDHVLAEEGRGGNTLGLPRRFVALLELCPCPSTIVFPGLEAISFCDFESNCQRGP